MGLGIEAVLPHAVAKRVYSELAESIAVVRGW